MNFWDFVQVNYHDEDFQAGSALLGLALLLALGIICFTIAEVTKNWFNRK